MKTAIATDTNSGITQEEARESGLYLLPMPVVIDGRTYLEGTDIHHQQLYEAMKQHRSISSSQPAPGQLLELWDGILADGYDEVVYIPMSSGLSSSCQSAALFSAEYDGRIQVVDNHRISVTQKHSVFSALELVRQGLCAAQIKAYLEERAYDASIYITVDSMEYLKKGGRITPAAAALAAVLNLKPVLTIQGDKLDTFAKARGMRQAEEKMIEAIKADRASRFGEVPDTSLQIDVAGTLEEESMVQRWLALAQSEFPWANISYQHLPCSIACHVGMNSAGLGITQISV